MSDLVGSSLGRYHLLALAGQGGMADVYAARDTRLGRQVAVKVIRPERLLGQERERALRRFEREVEAMARLNHPHIVRILDYSREESFPYLVMEWMPGGTLRQRLQALTARSERIGWQEAIALLLPVVEALEYAHQKGIVHRDVKPSNILFSELNQPALADFSIARLLHPEDGMRLTYTGVTLGTPEYMAPEQIHSKEVDARADIYSLGVVLYEMVTGRKPFQGSNPVTILLQISSQPIPSPRLFCPELPDAVEALLLQALAKSPAERFSSASVLARQMRALLDSASPSVAVRPSSSASAPDDQPTVDLLEESIAPPLFVALCPFCRQETRTDRWQCEHCGHNLQTVALTLKRVGRARKG